MRARLALTPVAYRRVTFLALVALCFIVVTGGAVRVTESGLGCPDWPTCDQGKIVAPLEAHALIEFVNRMITGLVSVLVIVAVLGALLRAPKRRDLTRLAWGLVLGVLGQIVLGGLVVLFHLYPPLVMGHFVLSMVLVANAVVLHHRAGWPDDSVPAPRAGADVRRLGNAMLWSAGLAIGLGTVVTGAGPHAGSHEGQFVERLPFDVPDVARFHGVAVAVLIALTLYTLWRARQDGAGPAVLNRGSVLLFVMCAQAAVGYVQYFTDVPAALVAIHIAGATALWVALLQFRLSLAGRRSPAVAVAGAPAAPPGPEAALRPAR